MQNGIVYSSSTLPAVCAAAVWMCTGDHLHNTAKVSAVMPMQDTSAAGTSAMQPFVHAKAVARSCTANWLSFTGVCSAKAL